MIHQHSNLSLGALPQLRQDAGAAAIAVDLFTADRNGGSDGDRVAKGVDGGAATRCIQADVMLDRVNFRSGSQSLRMRLTNTSTEVARDKKLRPLNVVFLDDTQHAFPIDVSVAV